MHLLSIPCIVIASINIYVAVYYLFFYFKFPRLDEHLPFAFLCASVGLYDIACTGLYNARSIVEGVGWQSVQFSAVNGISVSLLWFVAIVTDQKRTG